MNAIPTIERSHLMMLVGATFALVLPLGVAMAKCAIWPHAEHGIRLHLVEGPTDGPFAPEGELVLQNDVQGLILSLVVLDFDGDGVPDEDLRIHPDQE